MSNLTAIIDADYIKYAAAFAGQKSKIIVTHPTLSIGGEFKTRTDFYGHWAKKAGGWLAEYNKDKTSPVLPEEFTIEDVVTPEPLANVLHSTRLMYETAYKQIDASKHKGYIGKGDSFRLARSTLLKYKDRPTPKPIHIDAVSDYLERRMNCDVIRDIEVDDMVVIDAYKKPNYIVIGEDKDHWAQPVKVFNVNRPEEKIVNCDCFGKLWIDDKSEVRGYGRMFLYYQVTSQDDADCYAANCFSDIKWGSKSAYKLLKDCKDDREALTKVKECFQMLYPEPKEVVGWRGDKLLIDWRYTMQECFAMAKMLTHKDQKEIQLVDIMNKLGIET